EAERLLVVGHGQRGLELAQRARHVGRAAGAAGQWVAEGVVALRQRPAQPAVDLPARGVAGLPDADGLEVGEGRVGVADALDDGHAALVPQRLDALQVLVEAQVARDRQRRPDRHGGQLGPQVVQLRVRHGDHGPQAVVAARELDHDQDAVVARAVGLGRVDRPGEGVRHGRVAGGKARGAGAEDQAGPQEVAALELVDPDRFCHRSCTYLSWNSGDANARNQRAWSSAAALSRLAVCALRTVSRCAGAPAPGGTCRSWLSTALTKLTRATTLLDE